MIQICGIIPPRHRQVIGYRRDGYVPECIRPSHQMEPHIFLTPEGKYFAWQDDWDCDCCTPEEEDRCYVVGEISEAEALRLIEGRE
jgi:hypothetical protein